MLKDGNVRKLYSKDLVIVMKLYDAIRRKTILQNFRDHYRKHEILGSGSFASVIIGLLADFLEAASISGVPRHENIRR